MRSLPAAAASAFRLPQYEVPVPNSAVLRRSRTHEYTPGRQALVRLFIGGGL